MVTRYPVPGRVKTRLARSLGVDEAARLHRESSMMVCRELCAMALHHSSPQQPRNDRVRVEVWHAGGTLWQMRHWLGPVPRYLRQRSGDLGSILHRVMQHAFAEGAERCVVVGSDCPSLRERDLRQALDTLSEHELVLGPALDGGYWLLGMRSSAQRLLPSIFEGVAWGSAEVLAQTLVQAEKLGAQVSLLRSARDIDTLEDLEAWRREEAQAPEHWRLSVVIPTLNEGAQLGAVVANAWAAGAHEVLVVDGGSRDNTCEAAAHTGARVLCTPPGRARQMNAGAEHSVGELLLFLHADTRLPVDAVAWIRQCCAEPQVVAGAFTYAAAEGGLLGAVMSLGGSLRHRLSGYPYGDQAIFVKRRVFEALHGYPLLPVMEEWELVRRLVQLGELRILPQRAPSTALSFAEHGFWRSSAINLAVITAYQLGVDAERLFRWRKQIARRSA